MAQGLLEVTPERKQSKPTKQEPEKGHSREGAAQALGLARQLDRARRERGQPGRWCGGRERPGVRAPATRLEK